MAKDDSYVYVLVDPTKPYNIELSSICCLYKPFYIGKGSGYRIYHHWWDAIKNRTSSRKDRLINKLFDLGYDKDDIGFKIFHGTHEECIMEEEALINHLGYRKYWNFIQFIHRG